MRSLFLLALLALPATAQTLRVADLNTTQIAALDRERTVILLPSAVLEEHGPYLPAYADGYISEWLANAVADSLAAHGWTVLLFPTIPLGDGGANEIGGRFVFPGSFGIRVATLRAVFMDLADDLAAQGFQWVFVVGNHGSPVYNRALDEASAYFNDTYDGTMAHLYGLEPPEAEPPPVPPEDAAAANPFDIHAGFSETSRLLALRPDLVAPGLRDAPAVPGSTMPELAEQARRADWPGYFGAPAFATAEYGHAVLHYRARRLAGLALDLLAGRDPATIPRYADLVWEEEAATIEGIRRHDAEAALRQRRWLEARGIE